MLLVQPDFYDDFKCLAGECKKSCCIGWEIDIDEDTAEHYSAIHGPLGAALRENIAAEPEPHFVLKADERCPFLNGAGLCRLIIELGEDALCDICREHPRFYNYFPGRTERGLGLCCEAAAMLLLSGKEPLEFAVYDDGKAEAAEEDGLLELRGDILKALRGNGETLTAHMQAAAALMGLKLPGLDIARWAGFYMSLERLDESWTEALNLLAEKGDAVDIISALDNIRYERIAEYFIFRHFACAESREQAEEALLFSFLSAAFVCALDSLNGLNNEHLRMYSAEIEYSDENIGLVLEEISRIRQ